MPWQFNQDAYNKYQTNLADWAKQKTLEMRDQVMQNYPSGAGGSGRTSQMRTKDTNAWLASMFAELYNPSGGMNQFWEYQKTPAEEAMEQQALEQMRQATRAGEEDYWNRKNANTEATIKPFGSILSQAWWAKARPGTYGGDMETGFSQRNKMDMMNQMARNQSANQFDYGKQVDDFISNKFARENFYKSVNKYGVPESQANTAFSKWPEYMRQPDNPSGSNTAYASDWGKMGEKDINSALKMIYDLWAKRGVK